MFKRTGHQRPSSGEGMLTTIMLCIGSFWLGHGLANYQAEKDFYRLRLQLRRLEEGLERYVAEKAEGHDA